MQDQEIVQLLEVITKQNKDIIDRIGRLNAQGDESAQSAELNELFSALSKAQSTMPAVYGRKENPYFKERYIDLGDMMRAARPSLSENGLAVLQQVLPNNDGQMILHTRLAHSSGQWIESRVRIIPPKSDTTTLKSYISDMKKIAYGSLVGIVGADDDDDGEFANATHRDTAAKGTALNTKYNPKENKLETVTKEQIEELEYELSDYPDIAEMVLDGLKIQNIADMPKDKFRHSVTKIRSIKNLREGKE